MNTAGLAIVLSNRLLEIGITQKELAERIGTTPPTIGRYLRGERLPDMATIGKLAEALNMTQDVLMESQTFTDAQIEQMQKGYEHTKPKRMTKCWDCALACGGTIGGTTCPWARRLRPVPGWVADEAKVKFSTESMSNTFIVIDCPLFIRDGYNGGLKGLNDPKIKKKGKWK